MRRIFWSIGLSLLAHACLIGTSCLLFPGAPIRPKTQEFDVTLCTSEEFPALTLMRDDPIPKIIAKTVEPETPKKTPEVESNPISRVTYETPNPAPRRTESPRPGVSPFHGPATRSGLSVVYVLDASGSMGQEGKLALAIEMLKASLLQLGPDVLFQIVVFDSRARILRIGGRLEKIHASAAHIAEAEALLDREQGEGSSRHIEGLDAAMRLHPDILFLISDTGEIPSGDLKKFSQWKRDNLKMHTILISQPSVSRPDELAALSQIHIVAPPKINP